MRDAFHRELEAIDQEIVRMGALVERSTQEATTALVEGDKALAHRVMEGDGPIDGAFLDIEMRSLTLLAQQAPVAGDLRLMVAILRVVNDLERAGDLAYNIAKLVQMDEFREPSPKAVKSLVSELGRAAGTLMSAEIDVWASKDETLAAGLQEKDDVVDDLHARLIRRLLELKDDSAVASAMQLAMIGRYFERIADHAVNIGELVVYYVTGDEAHLG
jgi:phosphate transport system protein